MKKYIASYSAINTVKFFPHSTVPPVKSILAEINSTKNIERALSVAYYNEPIPFWK